MYVTDIILQQKHLENLGNYLKNVGRTLIKLTHLTPVCDLWRWAPGHDDHYPLKQCLNVSMFQHGRRTQSKHTDFLNKWHTFLSLVILVPRDENDTGQKENEGLALVSNLPGPSKPLLGIITTPFSTHPPNLSTTTEPKKKKKDYAF